MSLSDVARDRIVGGIFLLAVAGIVLPMWFDGAGVQDLPEVDVKVPPVAGQPPPPMPVDGPAWKFREQMGGVAARGPVGNTESGERTLLGQPQPRTDSGVRSPAGGELPWTIQVASVSSLEAGTRLKDQLLAAGYHAYVGTVKRSDGATITRVSVGPIADRGEAERVRGELQSRYGYAGVLRRFDL